MREGKVISTRFQAMEKRGFTLMVQGVPAEQMPVIVPRICGVCSTAHHVAAVKALENAYGVSRPPLADDPLRCSCWGRSSRTRPPPCSSSPCPTGWVWTAFSISPKRKPDKKTQFNIARRALQVRQLGTDLITLAGGQFIHPVKAVVGGMSSGIDAGAAEAMRQRLLDAAASGLRTC